MKNYSKNEKVQEKDKAIDEQNELIESQQIILLRLRKKEKTVKKFKIITMRQEANVIDILVSVKK